MAVRERVGRARLVQQARLAGVITDHRAPTTEDGEPRGRGLLTCNADRGPAEVREYCRLDDSGLLWGAGPSSALLWRRRPCRSFN